MNFDYVIVGAGSAGCVLASRLSEDPQIAVALVEAGGPDRNFLIRMPAGFGKIANEPGESWHFHSDVEPNLGRKILLPRGKGLGGSSNINGLLYVRGQAADYDRWANLGATGWGWSDVLPYFKKSEGHIRGGDALHGGAGPLKVRGPIERDVTNDAIVKAFTEIGAPATADFNGEAQWGAGYYDVTIGDGERCSAAVAFLRPAEKRPNLTILTNAHVRRVVVDPDKRATGVEIDLHGGPAVLTARREVVLCAGAYQSPQILQLSGIGPGAHVQRLGLEVVSDRPGVGADLQDHFLPPMSWRLKRGAFSYNREFDGLRLLGNVLKYALSRRGPMTVSAAQSGAFVKSNPALDEPDIQFNCLPVSGDLDAAKRAEKSRISAFPGLTLGPYVLRPESRGIVMAASPDARAAPSIVHNYLAAEEDRTLLVAAMRIARAAAAAPSLAAIIESEIYPGPQAATDADLLAFARDYGTTAYHPVGTCRMGADPDAVVDPRLRVRGVRGLRVADASVMPRLVSGNTNAAAIMIGEKAADMILADARERVV